MPKYKTEQARAAYGGYEGWYVGCVDLEGAYRRYIHSPDDHELWHSQDYDRRMQMTSVIDPQRIAHPLHGPMSWEEIRERWGEWKRTA